MPNDTTGWLLVLWLVFMGVITVWGGTIAWKDRSASPLSLASALRGLKRVLLIGSALAWVDVGLATEMSWVGLVLVAALGTLASTVVGVLLDLEQALARLTLPGNDCRDFVVVRPLLEPLVRVVPSAPIQWLPMLVLLLLAFLTNLPRLLLFVPLVGVGCWISVSWMRLIGNRYRTWWSIAGCVAWGVLAYLVVYFRPLW